MFDLSGFAFLKLVSHYASGDKEKKYARQAMLNQVKYIADNNRLDLSTDPVAVSGVTSQSSRIVAKAEEIIDLREDGSGRRRSNRTVEFETFKCQLSVCDE